MCSLAPVSLAISMSAGDLELLAGSRPTLEGQTGRDLALVDLAVADQVLVLAVAHEDLAEHLAVVHAATEHARALHAATVIGEGDGAVGDHIAHLGHGLALKTAGHGARRIDAAVADLGSTGLDELHDGAAIGDGIGVGHGAHAGKAALGSCAGTALDVLFDLVAGARADARAYPPDRGRGTCRKGRGPRLPRRRDSRPTSAILSAVQSGRQRHRQARRTGRRRGHS